MLMQIIQVKLFFSPRPRTILLAKHIKVVDLIIIYRK